MCFLAEENTLAASLEQEIQSACTLLTSFLAMVNQLSQLTYQGQGQEVYISQFVDRLVEQKAQQFLDLAVLNHQLMLAHFKSQPGDDQSAYQDSFFPTDVR